MADPLRLAVRLARQRESEIDLRPALESWTVIDLAVGVIMGQNRCSQDEAVTMLKTASNHRKVTLRELATQLVASVSSEPARTVFEN
ncbi:hypothetical protein GCM10023160_19360 [Brachybacterium paraconglomeratum]|uniref:ANTAR domain-containing protein n=1 Tax=Brachybacterium paraconglomeratum TaxID=173362 RepID=UPI0031EDCE18